MAKQPSTPDIVNLNLRLPRELHAVLVVLAADQDRSLNSQIVRLLRQATVTPETEDES
jgi:predicted HicB family RNase H-like nuclease